MAVVKPVRMVAMGLVAAVLLIPAAMASARVLRVGSWHGIAGQYSSIQAAVDAAHPGDWILVGPGDYKTTGSRAPAGAPQFPAGVLITTPDLHLRGVNRHTVVVDGTKPGTHRCNAAASGQNYGPVRGGAATGLNGIMVYKVDDVSVQNLTVCNFLGGSDGDGSTGNEIWWNGGADGGSVGGWGYLGSYLTATSDFYSGETSAAEYGIFSSNWSGGTWNQIYASNFNDSGFYIGACQQICDQTIDHGWAENNALGYSGTNSGGRLVVENSQFDDNEDGFDTNSQNADEPSPQNGDCPGDGTSPITHTHSCWVFVHNYVHDNNNPNVPTAGSAAAGPVGTGMSLSGARNDTVMDNTFAHNDAWGAILVPYPDSGPPCTGGTLTPAACIFDEWGDAVLHNTYIDNGSYGNPTNGDIGAGNFEADPTDCFAGNVDTDGMLTTSPPGAETLYPACTGQTVPPDANAPFLAEVACDSGNIELATLVDGGTLCPPGSNYPRQARVQLKPLPRSLPTMSNPCAGVPRNPWCPAARAARAKPHRRA